MNTLGRGFLWRLGALAAIAVVGLALNALGVELPRP